MSRSWTRQFWSSNFEDHNSYLWNLSWYHYDFSICKIIFAIYGPQIHMYLCRTFVFNLLLNVIYFALIFDVFFYLRKYRLCLKLMENRDFWIFRITISFITKCTIDESFGPMYYWPVHWNCVLEKSEKWFLRNKFWARGDRREHHQASSTRHLLNDFSSITTCISCFLTSCIQNFMIIKILFL